LTRSVRADAGALLGARVCPRQHSAHAAVWHCRHAVQVRASVVDVSWVAHRNSGLLDSTLDFVTLLKTFWIYGKATVKELCQGKI
jgi:hypothetical protein